MAEEPADQATEMHRLHKAGFTFAHGRTDGRFDDHCMASVPLV